MRSSARRRAQPEVDHDPHALVHVARRRSMRRVRVQQHSITSTEAQCDLALNTSANVT